MSECPYCSDDITKVYHSGMCPKIKSVEYYPNGKTKKIEFKDQDLQFPIWPAPDKSEYHYTFKWLS